MDAPRPPGRSSGGSWPAGSGGLSDPSPRKRSWHDDGKLWQSGKEARPLRCRPCLLASLPPMRSLLMRTTQSRRARYPDVRNLIGGEPGVGKGSFLDVVAAAVATQLSWVPLSTAA